MRYIDITDANANIIPLRTTFQRSVDRGDELDLAATLSNCGTELRGCGESVRMLSRLNDQPNLSQVAAMISLLHAAERAVCAYAVQRGLFDWQTGIVGLPADCERSE